MLRDEAQSSNYFLPKFLQLPYKEYVSYLCTLAKPQVENMRWEAVQ